MRSVAWALAILLCLLATSGRAPVERVIRVSTAAELVDALRAPLDDVTIALAPGRYVPSPVSRQELDECSDNIDVRNVTVGLTVSGNRVRLVGPKNDTAIIDADATYQIYFDQCVDCEVDRLAIVADASDDWQYAGAAIGANKSIVRITNCLVRDDGPALRTETGPMKWVKGINALGSDLVIEFNEIVGNTWGIVLNERSRATVRHNLVEGIGTLKNGGGAMRIACRSSATVERNHFRRFTHGIVIASNVSVVCNANIIEDIYRDGIESADRAGLGRVLMEQNVIYRCGSAGIAVRADGDQKASRNIVVETGTIDPRASAIHIYGARADAAMRKNTLYDNTVRESPLDKDAPREKFWRARRSWTRTYRNTPVGVDGRHKFHESAFLTRYGRWMD